MNSTVMRQVPSGRKSNGYSGIQMRLPDIIIDDHPKDDLISNEQPHRRRRSINPMLRWYGATDALALVLAFLCAWSLAAGINGLFLARPLLGTHFTDIGAFKPELAQFLAIAFGAVAWFHHTGHYRLRMPFWLEANKIVGVMSFAMLCDGFLHFASKQDFSRLWLMSGWIFAAFFLIAMRAALRTVLRKNGLWQVPTLLVGGGMTAQDTRLALESDRETGYEITAQLKDFLPAFLKAGRSWEALCAAYGVDYIVIALDGEELAQARQPIAQLMREHVPFSLSPPLQQLPVSGMVPQYFMNHDVMLLTHNRPLEQPLPRLIKRLFDIAVSGSVLLVFSPLMLLIAMLVKRDGGPAFYSHWRLGLGGEKFPCFKFRSMVKDSADVLKHYLAHNPEAAQEWQQTQKLKNDPRITGIGRFLRRSSLDELPQLLNVLRGEMSLVGPRPIVVDEVSKYEHDIAHYYNVTPGITGLWQVSGRNDVSYAQRVQLDSWYVRNWSLWHDLAILLKTVPALLSRSGVY